MTEVLKIVDPTGAIKETAREGIALIRHAITEITLTGLEREINRLPFRSVLEKCGLVEQSFEVAAFLFEPTGWPLLMALREETERTVGRTSRSLGFASWNAVDTVVQKYTRDSFLSAHKDLKRHPLVIAIYTIVGACRFEVLESRNGRVQKNVLL